jgi:hypothetical protein
MRAVPFALSKPPGREVDWVNRYLDHECLRRVADLTLRSYAQHLLHFLRWWEGVHPTDVIVEEALTESTLLDYVRFQSAQQPPFSGSTINQRVAVADRALRATFPGAPRQIAPEFQVHYWRRAPMGLGRPLPAVSRLRVREPKRTIVPEMTMLYLDITLTDLQREFHSARSHPRHLTPQPKTQLASARAGLDGVLDSLRTTQHLVEMFRRTLPDGAQHRCLDRVSNRLTKILAITAKLGTSE